MSQVAHVESAVVAPEVSESAWTTPEGAPVVTIQTLPRAKSGVGGRPLRQIVAEAVARAEAVAIRLALQAAGGDVAEAARSLSASPGTVHAKMKRYGISPLEFEREATAPI
jgi:DNA-binding NtrC family response regulator